MTLSALAKLGSVSGGNLSVPAYFSCVAVITLLGFGLIMILRPTFSYSLRTTIGLEKPLQIAPDSFYKVRVAPLLEKHCTSCHGAKRQKAKLRLDSLTAAMRGGKHGAVIKPGSVNESELFTRISLPSSSDNVMPPEGRPRMAADEVTVIELWIASGASGVLAADAIKGAPPPVREVIFPTFDESAVEQARAPLAAHVRSLQARFPGAVTYISRGSAYLDINASVIGQNFGDAELLSLAPLRERIVRLDLSGTGISDASVGILALMTQVRVLRLLDTKVTDVSRAVASLTKLRQLAANRECLNQGTLRALLDRGVTIYSGSEALAHPASVAKIS